MERLWPLISNARALSINAAWDGEAGRLLKRAPGKATEMAVRFGAGCEAGTSFAFPGWTVWTKRLGGGQVAVLAINIGNETLATGDHELTVSLGELNDAAGAGAGAGAAASNGSGALAGPRSYEGIEVWGGGSLGAAVTSEQPWAVGALASRASAFAIFKPLK